MKKDGEWLKQKLAQSGFTLEDLASQSGLPQQQLEKMANNEEGTDEEWNMILSVLNDYPTLYMPSADLLDEIRNQIQSSSPTDPCTVYYGINQSDLLFVLCRFADLSMHGANVDPQYLFSLDLNLGQALRLFQEQQMAADNARLS